MPFGFLCAGYCSLDVSCKDVSLQHQHTFPLYTPCSPLLLGLLPVPGAGGTLQIDAVMPSLRASFAENKFIYF